MLRGFVLPGLPTREGRWDRGMHAMLRPCSPGAAIRQTRGYLRLSDTKLLASWTAMKKKLPCLLAGMLDMNIRSIIPRYRRLL